MPTITPINSTAKYKGECHSCGATVQPGTGRLARWYAEYGDKIGKLKMHQPRNRWIVYCDTCNDLIFLDGDGDPTTL